MPDTTRVLIVDDSPSMRRLIRLGIEADPDIQVVAEAGSAREARDAVNRHSPDVMTLDVEMPGMDGLEFLRRLMMARPMPVVMISSLTDQGSDAAVRALSLGAVDCIGKPRFGSANATFKLLADALRIAAKATVHSMRNCAPPPPSKCNQWNGKNLLIGASTGGVEALEAVLSRFPKDCPPTLVTQHMPAQFLVSFVSRLNATTAPSVQLARDGGALERGTVYIAPGGDTHLTFANGDAGHTCLRPGPKTSGHRPSVDELFLSAVPWADRSIAVLLTGMGSDGARGMLALRNNGGFCIAQDKASSVVYGMPRVAAEMGAVDVSLPLSKIADRALGEATSTGENVK